MTRHNLNANNLIGQGYDGASAMSGKFNGVQATIRRQHDCAVYVHCASHCLNLTLSHSCEQQSIRNATGVIQQTANFLNASARRVAMMERCLDAVPETKRRRVKQLCATRWVERHDAVTSFITLYPAIMRCLEQCADELSDAKAAATARMLLLAIQQPDFLVSACVLSDVLSMTHRLAELLQSVQIDLLHAMSYVRDVVAVLEKKRETADDSFGGIWTQAQELAGLSDTELVLPRLNIRQRNRVNVPAGSPQEYFKRSIFIPFLDHVLGDLKERFADHNSAVYCLSTLIPAFIHQYSFDDLLPALEMYDKFVDDYPNKLRSEFDLWKQRWINSAEAELPKSAIDSVAACNESLYPNVAVLLQVLATLPVTTATAERSFSTLKRLKTYLRSSMADDRLTSLALIHVHAETIPIDAAEVIDKFALSGPHKLNFLR